MEEKRLVFMGHDVDKVEDKDIRRLFKIAVKMLYQHIEREDNLRNERNGVLLKQIEIEYKRM